MSANLKTPTLDRLAFRLRWPFDLQFEETVRERTNHILHHIMNIL